MPLSYAEVMPVNKGIKELLAEANKVVRTVPTAEAIGMLGKDWAPHLLAASIMGAPAGLVMAKIMVPETDSPKTAGGATLEVERTESSVIEAAAKGAADGMHLAFVVGAIVGGIIAYEKGRRFGHDEEWCDSYFENVAKDRARRDKRGQFVTNLCF